VFTLSSLNQQVGRGLLKDKLESELWKTNPDEASRQLCDIARGFLQYMAAFEYYLGGSDAEVLYRLYRVYGDEDDPRYDDERCDELVKYLLDFLPLVRHKKAVSKIASLSMFCDKRSFVATFIPTSLHFV